MVFRHPKPAFNLFNNRSKHLYDNNSTYNVYVCVILVGSIKQDWFAPEPCGMLLKYPEVFLNYLKGRVEDSFFINLCVSNLFSCEVNMLLTSIMLKFFRVAMGFIGCLSRHRDIPHHGLIPSKTKYVEPPKRYGNCSMATEKGQA